MKSLTNIISILFLTLTINNCRSTNSKYHGTFEGYEGESFQKSGVEKLVLRDADASQITMTYFKTIGLFEIRYTGSDSSDLKNYSVSMLDSAFHNIRETGKKDF